MEWNDIACIVFVCVTANHLGLIEAFEGVVKHRLPIVNCPKCCTFWSTLLYGLVCCRTTTTFPQTLAISFLASYTALWIELFEAFIDILYMQLYEKVTSTNHDNTTAANGYKTDTSCTVSEL